MKNLTQNIMPNNGKLVLRTKKGFSLIEILVSLIIISLLVGAFAPIVTKKLKSSEITVGSFGNITSECDKYSSEGYKCLMCSSGSCTLCSSQINTPNGYYVDPAKSCEPKKCSDKFGSNCVTCNKEGCTSCPNTITAGYYADPAEGCVPKACSTKFANCSTCTKDTCTSCASGYGFNTLTKTCEQCQAGYRSVNGTCEKCEAGSVSSAGASSCTVCSIANHKIPNANSSACINKYCGKGQYIDGVTCTSCTGGTYQDSSSHQSTTCKTCSESSHLVANSTTGATACTNKYCGANEYIDGVTCKPCTGNTYQASTSHQNTTCSTCPANCSSCESATKCTGCTGNYTLNSEGKCTTGCNPQTVTLSGTTTQVTRFNMGDDPQCPRDVIASLSGVTFVPVGTTCTGGNCCWYGQTSPTTCTDTSGGIYSGCNRTVCQWAAADKICTSIGSGWNLPKTGTSMASWYPTNSTAATGLMLCDTGKTSTAASRCPAATCLGAQNNKCWPSNVWIYYNSSGDNKQSNYLNVNIWQTKSSVANYAFSVRCMKE